MNDYRPDAPLSRIPWTTPDTTTQTRLRITTPGKAPLSGAKTKPILPGRYPKRSKTGEKPNKIEQKYKFGETPYLLPVRLAYT